MLPASPALLALLNGTSDYLMADLYTFTLQDGTVLRWGSADFPIASGIHLFAAGGKGGTPGLSRGDVEKSIGLTVGTLDITLQCGDTVGLEGIPLPLAAHNGAFDNAQIQLDRAFMATWGDTSAGTVPMFYGNVGGVDPASTSVVLHCRDIIDLLNVQMPRNIFLPMCTHLLYDTGCTLIQSLFTFNYVVAPGASAVAFQASAPTGKPDGYFETGVLQMMSGAAAGSRRAVSSFDGTIFTMAMALPSAPAAGDTFRVSAGCSREFSVCGSRFGNLQHFRGFKDIPPAETAV